MANRKESAAKTRAKLVEAARELICDRGLDAVTVDEITERSGVAKGTFYAYFKRKEDIVFELSKDVFDDILREAENIDGSIVERLCGYLVRFAEHIEKSSLRLCREWVREVVQMRPSSGEYDKGKLSRDIAAVRGIIEDGVARGELRADTPAEELAMFVTEVVYGEMLCWCIGDGAVSFSERTRRFAEVQLPVILGGHVQVCKTA